MAARAALLAAALVLSLAACQASPEYTAIAVDTWVKESEMGYRSGVLQLSGGEEAEGLFSFSLSDFWPDGRDWDLSTDGATASWYSDIERITYMQLAVVFSLCNRETDVCSDLKADKAASLSAREDGSAAYTTQGTLNSLVLHTSFCEQPTFATRWYLKVTAANSKPNTHKVVVALKPLVASAHAAGTTTLTLTSPTLVLFGVPLEGGDFAEDMRVSGSVSRSSDASGNAPPGMFLEHVTLVGLGAAGVCPVRGRVWDFAAEVEKKTSQELRHEAADSVHVGGGERVMWFMALRYEPPADTATPSLILDVDVFLDGSVLPFYNCTGSCADRHVRYLELARKGAEVEGEEKPNRYYEELKLLFPRRNFPSMRLAQIAELDGQTHGKWAKYQKAIRVLELELGDTYAMAALHASGGGGTAANVDNAVRWLQVSLAELHLVLGKSLSDTNDLEGAEKHLRESAVLRGSTADLDELAYVLMKRGKYVQAEGLYRAVLQVQPSPLGHFALAAALKAAGNNQSGVVAEMEKGLAMDPGNAMMRTRLGQWRQYEGSLEGLNAAIDQYEAVLEISSEDILVRFLLAQSYYTRGDVNMSVNEYDEVLERHPMHCEARYNVIESMFQVGRIKGRREHEARALECLDHQQKEKGGPTIYSLEALKWMPHQQLSEWAPSDNLPTHTAPAKGEGGAHDPSSPGPQVDAAPAAVRVGSSHRGWCERGCAHLGPRLPVPPAPAPALSLRISPLGDYPASQLSGPQSIRL